MASRGRVALIALGAGAGVLVLFVFTVWLLLTVSDDGLPGGAKVAVVEVQGVIGVGADDVQAGGVLVFDWDSYQLQRRTLPALPAEARGNFRYIVSHGGLWAHPIVTNNDTTAEQAPYRLGAGGWSAEGNDTGRRP